MADMELPFPVQGIVIETARGTAVLVALGFGLLGLASGFVLWDTWSHKEGEYVLPIHLAKDSLLTSFIVGLCLLGGIGCFIAFLCRALFPTKLTLGDEVLQLARQRAAGSTVDIQLPYSNLAAVTCEREPGGFGQLRVGIDFVSPDAPGTYPHPFVLGKKEKGTRDLYLPGLLTESPDEIARLILERCMKRGS